jgi:hypothetical protein
MTYTPIDLAKASVVAGWLKQKFTGHNVYDTADYERSAWFYRLDYGTDIRYRVLASREFLEDHSAEEIVELLEDWHTDNVIKQARRRRVLITNNGVKVLREMLATC